MSAEDYAYVLGALILAAGAFNQLVCACRRR